MDGDVEALKAQIAALTTAVQALGAAKRAPRATTFAELAEKYERHVAKLIMCPVRAFLERFGTRQVAAFRRVEYIDWRAERAQRLTKRRRPPAVGTLNQSLRQTHAMLRWGVSVELIDENPLEGVPYLKGQRARETEIDADEDAAAFAGAPLLLRVYHAVCEETGARSGCEVRMMERAHVDRARSLIRFPRKNTKGQVMTRDVPISDGLLELLKALPAVAGSPYVFANPKTKAPYSARHFTRSSRPYLDRLTAATGDGRVVTHDRRHTRVSRLARGGMNPMASMKLIGHKTPGMHWKYLHVSEADMETMRAILEAERRGPHTTDRTKVQR